ncbi:MAG: tRNA uracil 4-sulfurtransferase ThiI [bacterium]
MDYNKILVRYGDLTLKGKNRKVFIERVYQLTREKLEGLECKITKTFDRMFIELNKDNYNEVVLNLGYVSGLLSYSPIVVAKTTNDLEEIKKVALELVKTQLKEETTFKVETKRNDKMFHLTSMEISRDVAGYVLSNTDNLIVDVKKPKDTLTLEVRKDETFLYLKEEKGLGGFPVGVGGKGLLMLSGGIDSPVAGYLTMKQGVKIECIHFESTPLTSIESAQKVVDLTKKIAKYAPQNQIKVHMVPFKDLHMKIIEKIPDSYNITIMRRMMYRLAVLIANKNNCDIIVNGESVGQVASQTLGSMKVINHVCNLPVIRPLATTDKNDIITLARKIDTFTTSIKPFEDCCTIYVPKSPSTNPKLDKCEHYETFFDFEPLVQETFVNTKSVWITKDSDLDLSMLGLEVKHCELK